jgi:hypothetical protein
VPSIPSLCVIVSTSRYSATTGSSSFSARDSPPTPGAGDALLHVTNRSKTDTTESLTAGATTPAPHARAREGHGGFGHRRQVPAAARRGRLRSPPVERIAQLDADVLLVQEVEHRDALREFNALPAEQGGLGGRYSWAACIDGNDPRRIDVGVMSTTPLGAVTSWKHVVHPDLPGEPTFSRDLLEIDVLSETTSLRSGFTCFVSHLKSHFIR